MLRAILLALGLATIGCRLLPGRAKEPSPQTCAECHQDIAGQWAASGHAIAWTRPEFAKETEGLTTASCLPCHAPAPVYDQAPAEKTRLRAERLDDGVDCAVCHATAGAYVGPYDSWGPHPMKGDRARLPCSAFCGHCHAPERDEFNVLYLPSLKPGQTPKQCVDCHMPARWSRLTQGHALSLAHPERIVRDHSFPIWTDEVLRDAVAIRAVGYQRHEGGQVAVDFSLVNQGAAHNIPTGKYGHRELLITVELFDAEGRTLAQEEQKILPGRLNALSPNAPTAFYFIVSPPVRAEPARMRVLVERVNKDRSFRRTLLDHQQPMNLLLKPS